VPLGFKSPEEQDIKSRNQLRRRPTPLTAWSMQTFPFCLKLVKRNQQRRKELFQSQFILLMELGIISSSNSQPIIYTIQILVFIFKFLKGKRFDHLLR